MKGHSTKANARGRRVAARFLTACQGWPRRHRTIASRATKFRHRAATRAYKKAVAKASMNYPNEHATPPRCEPQGGLGSGVIWNIIPYETPVIPAKAGIQSVESAFPKVCGVDSRFRGNDCGLERPCLANDTTTAGSAGSFQAKPHHCRSHVRGHMRVESTWAYVYTVRLLALVFGQGECANSCRPILSPHLFNPTCIRQRSGQSHLSYQGSELGVWVPAE
jgi:hypothetical protein